MTRRVVFATAALGFAVSSAAAQTSSASQARSSAAATYVNSKSCEQCHTRQAQSYRLTGMGRSFYRPQPENTIENYSNSAYYHEASQTHYTMIQRDGKYYQRRYQTGYLGKETNVEEKQIDFVMGSGNHARTYLHQTSRHTLQQLPLSWYAEKSGHWGMSPGYDRPDHPDSRRLVEYECMFCHNAYPQIPAASQEYGAAPIFDGVLPEGIDCQRCHGPGSLHVALVRTEGATRTEIRAAIVNPSRLSPEREMDVCAQCHLETTSTALSHSVLRYDRGPFSYRPGEPLSAFRLTFDRAAGSEDRFEIASSVYRLRRSACFLKSAGTLRCTTCHNPHSVPRGETATEHYNRVCRQCHGSMLDRPATSSRHSSAADCISCHMPKRRTEDVVNVVMTDHHIQRNKPSRDLLAERPESRENAFPGAIVAYDPKLGESALDQLDLAVAQVRELGKFNAGIPRLTDLINRYHPDPADYYLELADGLEAAGEPIKALPFYEEAARRRPGSTVILRKLATALIETKRLERAAPALQRVLKAEPGDPAAHHMLGQIYIGQGRNPEAVAALEKALAVDPDLSEARNNLGGIFAGSGNLVRAEREFREAMRIQPSLPQARANLANVLALNQDLPQATYYFESAIRLKPDYSTARLDYAQLLAAAGQNSEAESQAEAAVRADPNFFEAHELWGILLARRSEITGALREFQAALRIRPESSKAQLELGTALARAGDLTGATAHLRLAAQASDPEIRRLALELLNKRPEKPVK